MEAKVDWDDTRAQFSAWWNKESARPLIQAFAPRADVTPHVPPDSWAFLHHKGECARILEEFLAFRDSTYFGGVAYPNLWLNLGPGVLAAYFSNYLAFSTEQSTAWFEQTRDWDAVEALHFSAENPWWRYTLEMAEAMAPHAPGNFILATTDIGGSMDVLASLRGAQELLLDLMLEPDRVLAMLERIDTAWEHVYSELDQRIRAGGQEGTSAWMGLWCPERWYPLQCDFSAMISPQDFERLVIPTLQRHCRFLDKSIYHWDGPGQIPHLDLLLDLPELDGIQWVPGSGNPQCEDPRWYPLYEKILSRGKLLALHTFEDMTKIPDLLKAFPDSKLFIQTWHPSEGAARTLLETSDRVLSEAIC